MGTTRGIYSMRMRSSAAVFACVAAAAALGAGAASAGEITGNGQLKPVNGKSICAYSGQEDLQWYTSDDDTTLRTDPTKGDPSHSQNWGQIPKDGRDFLTSVGANPGISCNPTKSTGE
jgi:hypothetical protein